MEEELVGFEVAKLAKEKGFNIPCDGRWWIEPTSDWKFSKQGVIKCDNSMDSIARPTQSLLQKWLREVHKISVEVTSGFWDKGKVLWEYNVYKKDLGDESPCSLDVFKTYEEALEVGLLEGLKLVDL